MPVSRRGFLKIVSDEQRSAMSALLAARGYEDYQAQGAQAQTGRGAGAGRGGGAQGGRAGGQGGGRAARPGPPEGVEEIKISSNENPLGPGKAVLDSILGEFPEAGRYPFNSTPNETQAGRDDRGAEQGQAGERRARRRLTGDPQDLHPCVHIAVPSAGDRRADLRELHGPLPAPWPPGARDQGRFAVPHQPRRNAHRRPRRGHGVPEQPEQPDGDGALGQGGHRTSSSACAAFRRTR